MFLALKQDVVDNTASSLPQYDHRVCMIKDQDKIKLISNICPHQNAKLVCNDNQFVCPYHGRRFDLQGHGLNNSYHLASWDTFQSDALIFDKAVDFAFPVDLSHMKLAESRQDFVRNSPLVIMDVFLDIEHLDHVHSGIYQAIGIGDQASIDVSYFDNGSMQLVKAAGPTKKIDTDAASDLAAVWMAVYPGTMIEWQPGSLFVTVAHSVDGTGSKVQVFKYHDSRYDQTVHSMNDKIWETAWQQDRHVAENIVELANNNINELQQNFRQWLTQNAG